MNALSVSEVAANAGVTSQAVSIALSDERLTAVEVIGRRAVKQDAKYAEFLKSTRNRNGAARAKKRSNDPVSVKVETYASSRAPAS